MAFTGAPGAQSPGTLVLGEVPAIGSYGSEVLADAPMAYWRLGDASGASTIVDSSGNGNTASNGGTHNGNPIGSMVLGQPSLLTSDSDTSASTFISGTTFGAGLAPFLNIGSSSTSTIECWFKYIGDGPAADSFIYGEGSTSNSTPIFGLAHVSAQDRFELFWRDDANHRLSTLACDTASGTFSSAGRTAIRDGTAHHLAVTRSGNNVTFYYDGISGGTTDVSSTGYGTLTANASVIGALGRANVTNNVKGYIDELAIYNKALSPARVATHYFAGIAAAGGLTSLVTSRQLAYDITSVTSVVGSRQLAYNIINQLIASRQLKYDILNQVVGSRQVTYQILNAVTSNRQLAYDILAGVIATRQLKYDLLRGVVESRQLSYNIGNPIAPARSTALPLTWSGS